MYVDWIPLYRNCISEVQSYDLFPTPFLIKISEPGQPHQNVITLMRYGKDRLFLFCTGSSREGTLQTQGERHINHRYSNLSLWRRRLRIYV